MGERVRDPAADHHHNVDDDNNHHDDHRGADHNDGTHNHVGADIDLVDDNLALAASDRRGQAAQ